MNKLWSKIAPVISPGIRTKLTVFTLIFVSALLASSFLFSYLRQKEDLSRAYDREIRAPLDLVSANVGELHKIAEAMIQLETFRIRLRQKTAEARRFRGVKTEKDNVFKWLGRKTGIRKQHYESYDTYYSTYLTDKNLKEFENLLKSFIDVTMNASVSTAEFTRWKALAAQAAPGVMKLAVTENPPEKLTQEVARLRAKLLADLRKPFGPLFSSRLERMDFRPSAIRILSYNAEQSELFDTAGFFHESEAATRKLFRQPQFVKFRKDFFDDEKSLSARAEFDVKQTPFETQFSPVFVNIPVVERARRASDLAQSSPALLKEFLVTDAKFAADLKNTVQIKAERIKILRAKGVPPFRDPEFMTAMKEYRELVEKRDAALATALKYAQHEKEHFAQIQAQIKQRQDIIAAAQKKIAEYEALVKKIAAKKAPEDAPSAEELQSRIEAEQRVIETAESEKSALKARETSIAPEKDETGKSPGNILPQLEALLHLRDAALIAKIRLGLMSEQDVLNQQLKSGADRKEQARAFQLVRQFIYDAKNETEIPVPRGVKSPLAGGVLAVTRTEAEDYMHLLDTSPLVGEGGLSEKLVAENVVGFNLAIINKSEGLERIRRSTLWLIGFSSVVGVLAIIAAWFFSGFAVRRIASLSRTSAEVRDGNLQVTFNGKGYDELATLGQDLNSMVKGLKEREELKGEMAAAEEIQKRLLPANVPANLAGRADIAGFYKAMVGIGGDYFDYLGLGNEHVAIAMGDVSNHGVGPALVMAMTRAQLHSLLREKEISLKSIMVKLNGQLYEETPAQIFVTFWLAHYNLKTGELSYISAGHSKPLIYRAATGTTEFLEAGGMPLGMDENDFFSTTLELRKTTLGKGDVFLQYTDGLSEAMNPEREQYGYDRMEVLLKNLAGGSAAQILEGTATAVEEFTGTTLRADGPSELSDDIALVCLKRV